MGGQRADEVGAQDEWRGLVVWFSLVFTCLSLTLCHSVFSLSLNTCHKYLITFARHTWPSARRLQLKSEARSLGLIYYVVHDAGRTQIEAGSVTVLGIGPGAPTTTTFSIGPLEAFMIILLNIYHRQEIADRPRNRPAEALLTHDLRLDRYLLFLKFFWNHWDSRIYPYEDDDPDISDHDLICIWKCLQISWCIEFWNGICESDWKDSLLFVLYCTWTLLHSRSSFKFNLERQKCAWRASSIMMKCKSLNIKTFLPS